MNPSVWAFDESKHQALARRIQTDEGLQHAVNTLWERVASSLLAVAQGQQMGDDGPFVGGMEPALHTALSHMLLFALYNEDESWLPLSERLTVVGPGTDPKLAARLASERLKREDPRRG